MTPNYVCEKCGGMWVGDGSRWLVYSNKTLCDSGRVCSPLIPIEQQVFGQGEAYEKVVYVKGGSPFYPPQPAAEVYTRADSLVVDVVRAGILVGLAGLFLFWVWSLDYGRTLGRLF